MTECVAVETTDENTNNMQQSKEPEEDYREGCFRENYLVPHVCPIATGKWCKDYTKCKNMEGNQSPPGPSFLGRDDSGKGSTS